MPQNPTEVWTVISGKPSNTVYDPGKRKKRLADGTIVDDVPDANGLYELPSSEDYMNTYDPSKDDKHQTGWDRFQRLLEHAYEYSPIPMAGMLANLQPGNPNSLKNTYELREALINQSAQHFGSMLEDIKKGNKWDTAAQMLAAYSKSGPVGAANVAAHSPQAHALSEGIQAVVPMVPGVVGDISKDVGTSSVTGDWSAPIGDALGLASTAAIKPIGRGIVNQAAKRAPAVASALDRMATKKLVKSMVASGQSSQRVAAGVKATEVAPDLLRDQVTLPNGTTVPLPSMMAKTKVGFQDTVNTALKGAQAELNAAYDRIPEENMYPLKSLADAAKSKLGELMPKGRRTISAADVGALADEDLDALRADKTAKLNADGSYTVSTEIEPGSRTTRAGIVKEGLQNLADLGDSASMKNILNLVKSWNEGAKQIYTNSSVPNATELRAQGMGYADLERVGRKWMAEKHPELVGVNAKYHLLQTASDVLAATDALETVRNSGTPQVLTREAFGGGAGALVSTATGHSPITGAVVGMMVAPVLDAAINSGVTTQIGVARMMAKMADAIRKGQPALAQAALLNAAKTTGTWARIKSQFGNQKGEVDFSALFGKKKVAAELEAPGEGGPSNPGRRGLFSSLFKPVKDAIEAPAEVSGVPATTPAGGGEVAPTNPLMTLLGDAMNPTRRQFLKTTGAAVASTLLPDIPLTPEAVVKKLAGKVYLNADHSGEINVGWMRNPANPEAGYASLVSQPRGRMMVPLETLSTDEGIAIRDAMRAARPELKELPRPTVPWKAQVGNGMAPEWIRYQDNRNVLGNEHMPGNLVKYMKEAKAALEAQGLEVEIRHPFLTNAKEAARVQGSLDKARASVERAKAAYLRNPTEEVKAHVEAAQKSLDNATAYANSGPDSRYPGLNRINHLAGMQSTGDGGAIYRAKLDPDGLSLDTNSKRAREGYHRAEMHALRAEGHDVNLGDTLHGGANSFVVGDGKGKWLVNKPGNKPKWVSDPAEANHYTLDQMKKQTAKLQSAGVEAPVVQKSSYMAKMRNPRPTESRVYTITDTDSRPKPVYIKKVNIDRGQQGLVQNTAFDSPGGLNRAAADVAKQLGLKNPQMSQLSPRFENINGYDRSIGDYSVVIKGENAAGEMVTVELPTRSPNQSPQIGTPGRYHSSTMSAQRPKWVGNSTEFTPVTPEPEVVKPKRVRTRTKKVFPETTTVRNPEAMVVRNPATYPPSGGAPALTKSLVTASNPKLASMLDTKVKPSTTMGRLRDMLKSEKGEVNFDALFGGQKADARLVKTLSDIKSFRLDDIRKVLEDRAKLSPDDEVRTFNAATEGSRVTNRLNNLAPEQRAAAGLKSAPPPSGMDKVGWVVDMYNMIGQHGYELTKQDVLQLSAATNQTLEIGRPRSMHYGEKFVAARQLPKTFDEFLAQMTRSIRTRSGVGGVFQSDKFINARRALRNQK